VTFPLEEAKVHLAWINFEAPSELLLFGVQDSGSGEGSDSQDQQSSESEQTDASQSDSANEQDPSASQPEPQEVNALYERLLQEMESRSQPLDQEVQAPQPTALGRDY